MFRLPVSGSHLQSQVKSRYQMMVFMSLVLVLIGQFCRDVIGCSCSCSCSDWSVVGYCLFVGFV